MWITDWTARAACRDAELDLFAQGAAQLRSKLLCRGCPVRTECLADALDNRIEYGVWGGMTERERAALIRRRPDVKSWRELLETAKDEFEHLGHGTQYRSADVIAEFKKFYTAEFNRIVRFVIKHGVRYHDAYDAVQTAFMEAYRQWEKIRNPEGWLRRVAIRSLKRQATRPFEIPTDQVPEDYGPLVPDNVEVSGQTRVVIEAMRRLPPLQRAVMAWTYDGYSPAEIAAELGMTAEAVRKNLQRARGALKRTLSGEGGL